MSLLDDEDTLAMDDYDITVSQYKEKAEKYSYYMFKEFANVNYTNEDILKSLYISFENPDYNQQCILTKVGEWIRKELTSRVSVVFFPLEKISLQNLIIGLLDMPKDSVIILSGLSRAPKYMVEKFISIFSKWAKNRFMNVNELINEVELANLTLATSKMDFYHYNFIYLDYELEPLFIYKQIGPPEYYGEFFVNYRSFRLIDKLINESPTNINSPQD